jgi:hypothetical protein
MGGAGGTTGGSCGSNLVVMSSGEHQHTLLVTPAEIAGGTDVTVLSSSTLGHAHYVRLTAADFAALKAGMEVRKKSCAGPDHEWVLSCNSQSSPPAAPACSDDCGDDTSSSNACQ